MDTQQQSSQSSTKNIKNLSIKEFFTTRLMRAKSFEAGPNSTKDEASNWFDEFKARMTKKSQASKQAALNANCNLNEENNDESNDSGETSVRFASTSSKSKKHHHKKDDSKGHSVKDNCDSYLSKLTESDEDLHETIPSSPATQTKDNSDSVIKSRFSSLRERTLKEISSAESPDFDTASINTIFNRRDSRYEKTSPRKQRKPVPSRLSSFFSTCITYLLAFNYNLPWKLLTLMNFTFVIIVIGLVKKANPDVMAFSFFNGFITGALAATVCFGILILSFLVQIIPKSQPEIDLSTATNTSSQFYRSTKAAKISPIPKEPKERVLPEFNEPKEEDFSSFEVLESGNNGESVDNDNENLLEDENYKGWMIEFIGDYEMRNKSDIKLKLIFVKFENRVLYLCKPKNSHEAESATFPVFVQKRIYDLNIVRKFTANLLLPNNVRNRQKWVWSKKYPIRLEFFDSAEHTTNAKTTDPPKSIQLTLFAKSCREKEEWFRRFKALVDENRLIKVQSNKRASIQSNLSEGNSDYLSSSVKSFGRSPSPSIRREIFVQPSRSSHVFNDSKRAFNDEGKETGLGSNLIRTKSCEELHADPSSTTDPVEKDHVFVEAADDSTLTRETAEMFSQAVEYSNFLESRPNLNYKEYIERVIESGQEASSTSDWFNALTGRIFFDVFSHNYWSVWFKRKIQRKLYRIRLPYFMETLTLTKIDLGTNAPQFLNVGSHSFDSFGLSIDFDMAYSGGLSMTFETKLNLLKIKTDNSSAGTSGPSQAGATTDKGCDSPGVTTTPVFEPPTKEATSSSDISLENFTKDNVKPTCSSSGSARTSGESSESDDSESDTSSDSSVEADVDEISDWEDYGAEKTRQSIVRFVDKIASSRYFQHATENRYIKKKLQDISNCPLVLVVQILSLNGVLTLNVPPPQTDRVWYGFKPNPELTLKALPKMGDREVNLSHVTDWIERKLAEEFRKILVIPNMEDIVLPVLKSDHLLYVTTTK